VADQKNERLEALIEGMASHRLGGLNPDGDQIRELVAADLSGPLHFVNLLAFRDEAQYPDGHELAASGLSGADAYARYGVIALDHVARRGGRLTFYNDVEQVLVGPGRTWHQVAIMEYPSTRSFIDMITDPRYLAGLVHRDAGLAETVVLVTRPRLGVGESTGT
jgi:uncharacterized protein (DUF1330 family)